MQYSSLKQFTRRFSSAINQPQRYFSTKHSLTPTEYQKVEIANTVVNTLVANFEDRVPSARKSREALEEAGKWFKLDHIAFRGVDIPNIGIKAHEELLLPLGYARCNSRPLKLQSGLVHAVYYKNILDKQLPIIFVSEYLSENFSNNVFENYFNEEVIDKYQPLDIDIRQALADLTKYKTVVFSQQDRDYLTQGLLGFYGRRWDTPSLGLARLAEEEAVRHNDKSLYLPWFIHHGASLMHPAIKVRNIKETISLLKKEDIKMAEDSAYRDKNIKQIPTKASVERVPVKDFSYKNAFIETTYGYTEFIERERLRDKNGRFTTNKKGEAYFEGFRPDNATRVLQTTNKDNRTER
jgi:hypothetical protein